MTATHEIVLCAAGVLGGALNTAGAGGGVIIVLTLLAAGMPPQVAVATMQASIPASFLGAVVPTWRNRRDYQSILPGVIAAMAGTAVGVWLVSQLSAPAFRVAAPGLMAVAGVLLVVQPYLPRVLAMRGTRVTAGAGGRVDDLDTSRLARPVALPAALAGVALYAGAFGGGAGVAVLVVFTILTPWTWRQANSAKNAICLLMSLVCSGAFLATGLADLSAVLILIVSQIIGGALGVKLAQRLPEDLLRRTVAATAVLGAVAMTGSN